MHDNIDTGKESTDESTSKTDAEITNDIEKVGTHSGKLLFDASAFQQNIRYSTDLKLLNTSREKTAENIDNLNNPVLHEIKKKRIY